LCDKMISVINQWLEGKGIRQVIVMQLHDENEMSDSIRKSLLQSIDSSVQRGFDPLLSELNSMETEFDRNR